MALTDVTVKSRELGDGASKVDFSIPFTVIVDDSSETEVWVRDESVSPHTEVLQVEGSGNDYTLTGAVPPGFHNNVRFNSVPAATDRIIIIRKLPLTQTLDLTTTGKYQAVSQEQAYDRIAAMVQELDEKYSRCIQVEVTTPLSNIEIPIDPVHADKLLVINATGDGLDVSATVTDLLQAEIDAAASAAAALASEIAAAASETAAAASETAAAASETAAGVSETNAAASETAAGVSETNAAASETAAGVSETNAAASETAAGVSETNAAASETAAGVSETNAGTSESNAAASETAAGVSETNAAASETAAAISAAAAATSAASSLWNDVAFKTNADSPIAIVDGDAGTMFAVDCSAGNVVINLPLVSVLTLSGAWSVGIKKTDTSSNTITINRSGSDTIDGGTSLTISRAEAGTTLLPDTDPTPDEWTSLTYGEVPITGAIVGTTDTQDLSSKTFIDAITMQEVTTPSTPASGDKKIYPKSDGKLYTLDSAGNEIEVGSGGGGGGVNYVKDLDAEAGQDNTTATANITKALETTNFIRGAQSHKFTIDTLATTADYVEFDLDTFDIADTEVSKAMRVSFEYYVDSNYTADDLQVVLYDSTAASDVGVQDVDSNEGKLYKSTNIRRFHGVAYTTAGNTGYKLRLNVVTAPSSDSIIYIDNLKVGPDVVTPGAIITEWADYSPATAGLGTVSFAIAQWRRSGDSVQFRYRFTTGTVSAVTASISPPSEVDGFEAASQYDVGSVNGHSSSPLYALSALCNPTSNDIEFGLASAGLGSTTGTNLGTGNLYSFTTHFMKVTNWSAGALLSGDEVLVSTAKIRYKRESTQTLTTATNAYVNFDIKDYDDLNVVTTGAGWNFVAPKSGEYVVSCSVFLSSTTNWTAGESAEIDIHVDGSYYSSLDRWQANASSVNQFVKLTGRDTVRLTKGQTIKIDVVQGSGSNLDIASNAGHTFVTIEEQPDFSIFSVLGETDFKETSGVSNITHASVGVWQDLITVELTPGEWDMVGLVTAYNNGTVSQTNWLIAISENSANTTTDHTDGINELTDTVPITTSGYLYNQVIPMYRVIVTATKTYYLKFNKYATSTNFQASNYRISARKIK